MAQIAALDCGAVMLTLAPNRVAPELVKALADEGVLVSLGHSDATYAEAEAALDAGARAFTHLFNAMSQMNGREPGMAGAAMADSTSYVGIIADGHHVHDAALKVALAAKHPSRMMLITDAMPTAAGGPERFDLQGREVVLEEGRLSLIGWNARGLEPDDGRGGPLLRTHVEARSRPCALHGLAKPGGLPAARS